MGAKMGKKCVIFDFDGTMMDTNKVIIDSLNYAALKYRGCEVTAIEFESILGKPIVEQMAALSKEYCDEMVTCYRETYRAMEDGLVKPFEGIIALLEELKESGIVCAILTNKGRRGLDKSLAEHQMAHYFSYSLTANDIQKTKPDPYGIYKICEYLDVSLSDTIMVGDSGHDIEAGKRAGVRTVLVDWSILNLERLKAVSPDYIISDPKEILDIINVN